VNLFHALIERMPCSRSDAWPYMQPAVALVITWMWWAATSDDNSAAAMALVWIMGTALVAVQVKAAYDAKNDKTAMWTTLASAMLLLVALARGTHVTPSGNEAAIALTDDVAYACIMLSITVATVAVPGVTRARKKDGDGDDALRKNVHSARHAAVATLWCLLALYAMYLVRQIAIIVRDYDDNIGGNWGQRWTISTTVPANTTVCNAIDHENDRYGLLYDDRLPIAEHDRFTCAYQLHENLRLNAMVALTVWIIYRVGTHTTALELAVAVLVFVAVSTAIDDLRQYWVLKIEQAGVLTVTCIMECLAHLPHTPRAEVKSGQESVQSSTDSQPDENPPYSDAHPLLPLVF